MDAAALSLGKVLTFFLLTLGPFSVIRPFARATASMDRATRLKVASGATIVATLSILIAATVGVALLKHWGVSVESLLIAAGLLLFLYSLSAIRGQYVGESVSLSEPDEGLTHSIAKAAFRIAFPYVVSPYGIAVVVLVLAVGSTELGEWALLGILLGIMLLNCLAMLGAHSLIRSVIFVPVLSMVSSVLIVLQAALGVEAVLRGVVRFGLL